MHNLNAEILQNLQDMLDTCNPYILNFCQARDLLQHDESEILMCIYCNQLYDIRCYNTPTASDVAVIMVDNGNEINSSN